MSHRICSLVVCVVLLLTTCASDDEKRLLLSDPTHFETEIQQLKAKMAELSTEVAALKSKANNTENEVAFTACHTLGAKLGPHQTVKYNTVVSNIGNRYDARDGHFVAPISGLYSFSLTGMASLTTTIFLGVMKNNVELVRLYTTDGYADSASITAHTHLDVNDHVWVENVNDADAQLHEHAGKNYNCFSGILDQTD